jgi:uncharacterized membrane protein HdeD (DUF308 family)
MNKSFSKFWWVFSLRGLVAILFGVLAITWPGLTMLALVLLFAFYAVVGGVASVIGAVMSRKNNADWWMPLLWGLVSIGAAVIALIHPDLTVLALMFVIAANALMIGILDIAAAIQLRKVLANESLMLLSGIAEIVFGILVLLFPQAGAIAMVFLISTYTILTGILLLFLSLRLRTWFRSDAIAGAERRITTDRRMTSGIA